jgi:hypothetical protein
VGPATAEGAHLHAALIRYFSRRGRRTADPTCPLCGHIVGADTPAVLEHGVRVHLECRLGLVDAGAAVARMLGDRAGQWLCLTCIADALVLTPAEAEEGVARVRDLAGFASRFGSCAGCGRRGRVVRALRFRSLDRPGARDRAAGEAQ